MPHASTLGKSYPVGHYYHYLVLGYWREVVRFSFIFPLSQEMTEPSDTIHLQVKIRGQDVISQQAPSPFLERCLCRIDLDVSQPPSMW